MKKLNENYTIYLDADGVLCDFEKKVSEINGLPFHKISRGKLWSSIEKYDKEVEPFFENLEKMPDADELLNFVNNNFINIFILTACGNTPKNAAQQKRNWFRKNYPNLIVKTVQDSKDKAKFANSNSILVDDRSKSIDPWKSAGGIGILHTSARNSIEEINMLLDLCI